MVREIYDDYRETLRPDDFKALTFVIKLLSDDLSHDRWAKAKSVVDNDVYSC